VSAPGFSSENDRILSGLDELPFWAAPFGLRLLEAFRIRPAMTVLDVGFGTGFPTLELAMRLGAGSIVHGLDPATAAHRRTALKCTLLDVPNVRLHLGSAEATPFPARTFDAIVSNNGFNNVPDLSCAFREAARIARPGSQLVFTMNLDGSFEELHHELRTEMDARGLHAARTGLEGLIERRRPPLTRVIETLSAAGFTIETATHDAFAYRFATADAVFSHAFFRRYQLPGLRALLPAPEAEAVFAALRGRLSVIARQKGEIVLGVPFATVSARRDEHGPGMAS
jgi:ubiquinone/menaquinone biosynthesis C-methylase UbiE